MGYHLVDPNTLPETGDFPCDRRSLSETAGLTTLAAAVYVVDPGERLARHYHVHDQREELFYVVSGTLHVQTPDRTFEVEPDRLFVVEPGNPILPHVPDTASESARVLGVGAPQYDAGRPYDPEA